MELGEEAAFLQMLEGRRKLGRSVKCCNAAYVYAIYGAIHDIDWPDVPVKKKDSFKTFTAKLRASSVWAT